MKKFVLAPLLLLPMIAGCSSVSADSNTPPSSKLAPAKSQAWKTAAIKYELAYEEAVKQEARPGRNLVRYGVKDGEHIRRVTTLELRLSALSLEQMGTQTVFHYNVASKPIAEVPTGLTKTLARLAKCESAGNPRATASGGLLRGKYLVSVPLWESAGGSGDPVKASTGEQDRRAAYLLLRDGSSLWPICGAAAIKTP